MKAICALLIVVLTAAVLCVFFYPLLPEMTLPAQWQPETMLVGFPFIDEIGGVAVRALHAVAGSGDTENALTLTLPGMDDALSGGLWGLLLVSLISVLVSVLLGRVLYAPLFPAHRGITRLLTYGTLNLISVMVAWLIYRRFFVNVVLDEWIAAIPGIDVEGLAGQVTQALATLGVGAAVVAVLAALFAARLLLTRVLLPVVGGVLRTMLFAAMAGVCLFMLRQPEYAVACAAALAAAFVVGGLIDLTYA